MLTWPRAQAPHSRVSTVEVKGEPDEAGVVTTTWQCEAVGLRIPVQVVDANNERLNRRGVVGVAAQAEEVLSAAVSGASLNDQSAVDSALWQADETERKSKIGGNAICAASLAVAQAAAAAAVLPLHEHVSRAFGLSAVRHMPVPIATFFSGFGATDGKLKARAIGVHPALHMTVAEGLAAVGSRE